MIKLIFLKAYLNICFTWPIKIEVGLLLYDSQAKNSFNIFKGYNETEAWNGSQILKY